MDPSSPRQMMVVEENAEAEHALDFGTIFELELGYVLRTLRRLGVAAADVEDMAHEVFMAAHGQLHRYDRARPIRPWLFAFAFNIASHYRRKAGRETPMVAEEMIRDDRDAPDELLEKERRRRMVLDALEEIDLSRRAVFVLHELDGFTCEEVARSLEIPIGTAYSRLRLAREDFAAAIRRRTARRAIG